MWEGLGINGSIHLGETYTVIMNSVQSSQNRDKKNSSEGNVELSGFISSNVIIHYFVRIQKILIE
jgi:hypothetical protein